MPVYSGQFMNMVGCSGNAATMSQGRIRGRSHHHNLIDGLLPKPYKDEISIN